MRQFFLLLTFFSISSAHSAFAEEISQQDRTYYENNTEAHVYTNQSGQTLPYRLFVPQDYDPKQQYPLLLSFHGAGSRGSDNLKQLRPWVAGWLDAGVQKKHPCIILMPQCPSGKQWVDTPWTNGSYSCTAVPISKSMTLAKELLDKIVKEKSIDRSRIYVMGASMGGYGTWNFVMRYPKLIAAAVPICGGGDPSMAHVLKNIPIWAFHGDQDKTVPPSGSQDMVDAIHKVGGNKIELTIYEGVQHDSYTRAWKSPKLVEWVFRQKKMDNKPDAGDGL